MPNYVYNIIQMKGDQGSIDEVLEIFKNDEPFNKIVPMPDGEGSLSIAQEKQRVRLKELYGIPETYNALDISLEALKTEEEWIASQDMPDSEKAALESDLEWYCDCQRLEHVSWAGSHWGTGHRIWDKEISEKYQSVKFTTAWSSCHQIIRALSHKYPDVTFTLVWADECGNNNAGILIWDEGREISCVWLESGTAFPQKFYEFVRNYKINEKPDEWDEEDEE